MGSIEKVKDQKGLWLFVVPVTGLVLTDDVNREITINKVTFVCKSKLPNIRKRLGFPLTIAELKKKRWAGNFFDSSDVYGICKIGGVGSGAEKEFFVILRNELSVLSLSQLGFGRRHNNASLAPSTKNETGLLTHLMMNLVKESTVINSSKVGRLSELRLDNRWNENQKSSFFFELLELLRGNASVSSGWERDIKNAVFLAGQSQSSSELPHAFLWNMIAIETLLTHRGDSYSIALPKRVEAFIGWTTSWSLSNYEERIKEAYTKRCSFVHGGMSEDITIEDLLFTDILLVNIFFNILKHLDLFHSKEALIDFSNKVEAEHVLGIKSKIRPKTMSYIEMVYSKRDYENI